MNEPGVDLTLWGGELNAELLCLMTVSVESGLGDQGQTRAHVGLSEVEQSIRVRMTTTTKITTTAMKAATHGSAGGFSKA
jgi:hypothetical protein